MVGTMTMGGGSLSRRDSGCAERESYVEAAKHVYLLNFAPITSAHFRFGVLEECKTDSMYILYV